MTRSVQILVGVVFLIIAAVVYLREGKSAGPAKSEAKGDAVFAWVDLRQGQAPQIGITSKGFNVIHITNAPKVRIVLKAKYPVNVGISTEKIDRRNIGSVSFSNLSCAETQTIDYQRECELPNREGYLLMTYEGEQSLQLMDFSLEAWQCTSNCQ